MHRHEVRRTRHVKRQSVVGKFLLGQAPLAAPAAALTLTRSEVRRGARKLWRRRACASWPPQPASHRRCAAPGACCCSALRSQRSAPQGPLRARTPGARRAAISALPARQVRRGGTGYSSRRSARLGSVCSRSDRLTSSSVLTIKSGAEMFSAGCEK